MEKLTPEFVYTQLRIAMIAGVAYAGGAGYFSPAGVTLSTALIMSLLPIIVPWGFSTFASWGVTKVPTDSVAAQVAAEEKLSSSPTLLANVAEAAARSKNAALLFLICFLSLGIVSCAQRPADPAAPVIPTVEKISRLTRAACAFVPTAITVDAIIRTGIADELAIAKGICDAISPTNRQTFMPSIPSYRGVLVVGTYLK